MVVYNDMIDILHWCYTLLLTPRPRHDEEPSGDGSHSRYEIISIHSALLKKIYHISNLQDKQRISSILHIKKAYSILIKIFDKEIYSRIRTSNPRKKNTR